MLWLWLSCARPVVDAPLATLLVGVWEDDLHRGDGLNTTRLFDARGQWAQRAAHWDEAPCDRPAISQGGDWRIDGGELVLTTTWIGTVDGGAAYGTPCGVVGGHEARRRTTPSTERLSVGACPDDWATQPCLQLGDLSWWRRASGDPVRAWADVCPWCDPVRPGRIEE